MLRLLAEIVSLRTIWKKWTHWKKRRVSHDKVLVSDYMLDITWIYGMFLYLMWQIAKDKEGYSPLQLASAYSQLDSTVILLRHYLQSAKFGFYTIFIFRPYHMNHMKWAFWKTKLLKTIIRLEKRRRYTRWWIMNLFLVCLTPLMIPQL